MPEQLKTVTVLFADVTGSTELGERLDPEAVRRVMERYFDLARRVIGRHGGTVEKFIGDAVMAVFGVPVVHEDDALRAVRAAADLRAELPALNAELDRDYGATLQLRTGVNTGEAVTASDDWLAAGDAVNTAARLEQVAAPGEILLGPRTVALVRDAVAVQPVPPVELRGKSAPLAASRLVEVLAGPGSPRRLLDTPMVGRAHQLRMLEDAFANVVRERTCGLFTLLGVAGVGKSRLAAEFVARIEATVIAGRCLSYGEGITYWPVTEVVRQLLGGPDAGREELARADDQFGAVSYLLGESAGGATSGDIAWAVRKLLERAAARKPLVVVWDDVHWGEQTFLDLVEQVADLSRVAPILLLCMARPELLERRPGWGGGKLNAATVLLEPLDSGESAELMDRLASAAVLADPALCGKILDAAAGNPLFLEEMAAVLAAPAGPVPIPPTIHALLAARLDQLDPAERRVLECGSVEGNSFHRGAVEALGPEQAPALAKLVALVRKDLVRPDEPAFPGDDAFRFRHLLIRDAAYEGLPKSVRARLHERFAAWLGERAGELAERDEIIGYHLEQAYRYRAGLGPVDAAARAVAVAAGGRLQPAGLRALERWDVTAAVNLLERASSLAQGGQPDVPLELSIVWALRLAGRFADAAARAGAAAARAAQAGDHVGELRSELARVSLLFNLDPEGRQRQLSDLVERARPVFERAGEHAALGSLWLAAWELEHNRCQYGAAAQACRQAIEHAAAAGERYLANWVTDQLYPIAIMFGPMPVADALDWLDQEARQLGPQRARLDLSRGELLALIGRFGEARAAHASASEYLSERGDRLNFALAGAWRAEMGAGQFAAAEQAARRCCTLLEQMDERSFWSTKACELAQALYSLGHYGEAETWARNGAEAGATDDVITQLLSLQVLAKVAARRCEFRQARALASRAGALADGMDSPVHQGDAALDVGEVLLLAGDRGAALEQARRAAAHYRRKGATAPLQRAVRLAAELAESAPA